MPLTKPAVTELTTESAPKALLAEWLASYFDGAAHVVGGVSRVFPRVYLGFESSPREEQPLSNPTVTDAGKPECEIRTVCIPITEQRTHTAATEELATDRVLFNFWITAKAEGTGKSEKLAENVGELLKAILTNPLTRYPLAQKGVQHLEPRPAELTPASQGAMRMVACKAQLLFLIKSI